MALHHHLLSFDRPLAAVQPTHGAPRRHTAGELAAARAAGYHEGEAAMQAFTNRQLVELRSEVANLQQGLLAALETASAALEAQVKAALPALAVDLGRRLLAGFEPTPAQVASICRDALDQLYPERADLELVVSPADATVLAEITPGWETHFPRLRVALDDTLRPGECLVRSRFGVTDARSQVKLDVLRHELLSA